MVTPYKTSLIHHLIIEARKLGRFNFKIIRARLKLSFLDTEGKTAYPSRASVILESLHIRQKA